MKTVHDVLYSSQLGAMSNHVFIDGVCVKSRYSKGKMPTIEDALATNQSVLVQTGKKITVHADRYWLQYYKSWMKFIRSKSDMRERNAHASLLPLFSNGTITVIKDGKKIQA